MSKRNSKYAFASAGIQKQVKTDQLDRTVKLKELIVENGFDTFGIVNTDSDLDFKKELNEFLKNNHHGDMDWMKERSHLRSNPNILWKEAKSIIVLGMNYHYKCNSLELLQKKDKAIISVYSRNTDYHKVIKKKLKKLSFEISKLLDCNFKYFVDTAPVMEKPISMRGGIGWQGKHTNLVSKNFGSWLFLSSIFIDKKINNTQAEVNHCGSCSSCIDICPTSAIIEPYKLDATKCISYLTIEHKGIIDERFRKLIGNRIYGCDDCLAACPWNKFAQKSKEINFHPKKEFLKPDLGNFLNLNDEDFRKKFSKSSIKRIGRDRFIRNVLIAVGNSKNKKYLKDVILLLEDESFIVRGMAVWSLKQLIGYRKIEDYKNKFFSKENNMHVKQEWLN